MASSRRSPAAEPPPAVTADRAARLCRLIRMTGTRGQPRETLLQRLNIDVRGFYRDLKLLRDVGIVIELVQGKYTLRGDAEEAVLKVLGTGWRGGIAWTDIEILPEPSGQPKVSLSGECLRIAAAQGIVRWHVSISHIETHATASAIGLREE